MKSFEFIIENYKSVNYMALNHRLSLCLALLALSASLLNTVSAKEVNSFNLLLPTSYHQSKGHARQIVITSGGCYDWQSTENSVIRVVGTHHGLVPSEAMPKNQKCNSNGIVELLHEGKYPSSVYVTARDQETSDLISIPVRIRDLKRVSIFTKSKIMNIKQIQNLQLYGFDGENNTFTSLEGLRFRWTITEVSDGQYSTGSISKIPLAESSLYMPFDTRKKLETEEGVETDLLVIKANRVGKVLIKVRCLEPNYELITDETTLFIQEKFQIWPGQPMYILAGSKYQYRLMTPAGLNISLPSPNYRISLSNPSFIVNDHLLVTAPRTDATTVMTVSDWRTSPPFEQSIEVSSLQPDVIEIGVPEQLVIGQPINYVIKFMHGKRQLLGAIDPDLLRISISQTDNNNKIFNLNQQTNSIVSTGKGIGEFKVTYNGLTSTKRINSVTPLKIIASGQKIILPVGETYQLQVVGGSGSYKYIYQPKQEDSLLSLSFNGLIVTRKEGLAYITVVDEKNQLNKIQVGVEISRIIQLSSLEKYKQFNLLEDGTLYVSAKPSGYTQYTQCNDVLLKTLTFNPSSPLQIIRSEPINSQSLAQIQSARLSNKFIQRTLKQRASINAEEIKRDLGIYLKYGEIKPIDLNKMILEMENYGLCARLLIKPVSIYDDEIEIRKQGDQRSVNSANKFNLRVYEPLRNNIVKLPQSSTLESITITPLGTLKWTTKGGPYAWKVKSLGDLEVYINDVKMDSSLSKKYEDYVFPLLTCPNHQKLNVEYNMTYKNQESIQLLLPVKQKTRLVINCRFPEQFRLGLPTSSSKLDNGQHEMTISLGSNKNSTIFLLPGQCFRFSVEPVIFAKDSTSEVQSFYNSSNVFFKIEGASYGKVESIKDNDSSENVQYFKYDTKNRRESEKNKEDVVIITAKEVRNQNQRQRQQIPKQLSHTINIKSIKPLSFKDSPKIIEISNLPNSKYILEVNNEEGFNRFSIKCDQSQVHCERQGNSIIITSQSVDRPAPSSLVVTDLYSLGHPQISIPIKVSTINGLDLRVARLPTLEKLQASRRDRKPIDKSNLQSSAWIVEGEQFIAIVDAYSFNDSNSQRHYISGIDPKMVQLNIEKLPGLNIREILRKFDDVNNVVIIVYQATSQDPGSSVKLAASLKSKGQNVKSNSAEVQLYPNIELKGISSSLPFEQLSIASDKSTTLVSKIDSFALIMQSCSTVLEIQGGPPSIKTKAISSPGDGTYFNIVKLDERVYRIDTIQATPERDYKNVMILGKEKNLIVISVIVQEDQSSIKTTELLHVRCLIIVAPIKEITIRGNNQLLANRHVRYLAEFGEEQANPNLKIIKQECTLKYKWSIQQGNSLILTSDAEKIGVNVTAREISITERNKSPQSSISALMVTVYNKHGREIGKSIKPVSVVQEDKANILTVDNLNSAQNSKIVHGSDELLLIPPNSGVRLPRNIIAQLTCPCCQHGLTLTQHNQLTTQQSSNDPQTIKLQYQSNSDSTLPTFASIVVTDICSVAIENVDGAVVVSPTSNQGNRNNDKYQFVKFRLLDCLGRPFLHYDYKNIEYRATITDPHVSSVSLDRTMQGELGIEGHQIGQTYLVLEVILNGVAKAKDVVPVFVNVFIQPSKPISVHLGDIITFKAPQTLSGEHEWKSSNSKVLKINANTGQAIASEIGESYAKLGVFSTRVTVVKLVDLAKPRNKLTQSEYEYHPVYNSPKVVDSADASLIQDKLTWKCQIISREKSYFRLVASKEIVDGKEIIVCKLEKLPDADTADIYIRTIALRVTAENRYAGFTFSKQFQEQLENFVVLSERYINPRDPKFKKHKNQHMLVIQTSDKLSVGQRGGQDSWILSNQFNGSRQMILLDLSQYKSGDWRILLTNPRTKQTEQVLVSSIQPESGSGSGSAQVQKDGWKWTDILVIFMAVNFLLILCYQIFQNSNGNHAKVF